MLDLPLQVEDGRHVAEHSRTVLAVALLPPNLRDLPVCFPGRACIDEPPGSADLVALTSALTPLSPAIAATCFALLGASIVLIGPALRRQWRGLGLRVRTVLLPLVLLLLGVGAAWVVDGRLGTVTEVYGGLDGRPSSPAPASLIGAWPSVEVAALAAAAIGALSLFVMLNTAVVRLRRPRSSIPPDSAAPTPMAGRAGHGAGAAERSGTPSRRLIVVCGLGGTGKTTLADSLSRALDVACLHKDDVKASLHDAGIETPRSFVVFQALAERMLTDRVDLIVEATWHEPADWTILRRWSETHDLELICVVCSADRAERERRIRTRPRHPSHADADRRQLAQLDVEVDYGAMPGRHIPIRTDADPEAVASAVLARLREPAPA